MAAAVMTLGVALAGSAISREASPGSAAEMRRVGIGAATANVGIVCGLQPGAARCRDADLFADAP